MEISALVEKYFEQIEVEDTDFIPVDDAVSDAAYILLQIPINMVREYQSLKNRTEKLPDGVEFWKETGLVNRLQNYKKRFYFEHAPLLDILCYLKGEIWGEFYSCNSEKIRLEITEIPEFHSE